MRQPESFARGALDTLPTGIAILDEDGRVVFTNRAFETVGPGRGNRDWRGAEFAATLRLGDPEDTERARAGIRSVLEGDRESFAMEYCPGESTERWYLLRASPFDLDGRQGVAALHVDITDRKRAEIEADETAARLRTEHAQLEHLLDRINGLVESVSRDVVGAESRPAMESAVCETFAATDPYVGAWIGHVDLPRERLRSAAAAGVADREPLTGEPLALEGEDLHPSARAVVESEPQVTVDPATLGTDPVVRSLADPGRVEALAALPLVYRETRYGVVTLYVEDAEVVDDRECVVLAALGRILTHGINARETKRSLSGDAGVELTVEVADPSVVANALAAATEGSLTFRGAIDREDEVVAFFTLEGGDPGAITPAGVHPSVRAVEGLAVHDGTAVLEVVADSFVGANLAEYAASLTDLVADGRRARLTVDLPGESTARNVYDLLSDRYEGVELVGYREVERTGRTAPEFRTRISERLTARQETVLRKAYLGGYYEASREVTGEELAESMGITRATFHQHLRAAERKVLATLFDG